MSLPGGTLSNGNPALGSLFSQQWGLTPDTLLTLSPGLEINVDAGGGFTVSPDGGGAMSNQVRIIILPDGQVWAMV